MWALSLLGGCAVTPEPMSFDEKLAYSDDKLSRVTANQEPITGKIDIYEATARALKYNLDAKVAVMQRAVSLRDLDLSNFARLPDITASSGYAARNNDAGSSSKSLLSGNQSLEVSTSQEREMISSDLSFSWNILDFGLSYVRARQTADQALIAEETRRKVVLRIVEDVRTAYWRAASGQRLIKRLTTLERRVKSALRNSRTLADRRETSPLAALTYQRELIGIRRDIHTLESELVVSKAQLAALMNVPPNSNFTLVETPHGSAEIGLSTNELIEIALTHRPELAEMAYKGRIDEKEATAALLSMLPGLQLYGGPNHDTNTFIYNADWISWGAKASWNALKLFQYPTQMYAIEEKSALLDQQALALTMAVMTQVHVSRIRYLHALTELQTAREYLKIQISILEQMRAQNKAGRISEQALIREEMNTLLADAKRDLAYAGMQNTVGGIFASIGLDPLGGNVSTSMDVKSLAKALRESRPTPTADTRWTPVVTLDTPPANTDTDNIWFAGFTFGRSDRYAPPSH